MHDQSCLRCRIARVTVRVAAALPAILLACGALLGADLATRVEQAAAEAAAKRVRPPDRFELLSSRFGGADPLPAGKTEILLDDVRGPNASGHVAMRFRILVDGEPHGLARAGVRGVVRGPGLVATRTLRQGESIPGDAVELRDLDLTRLNGAPLRSIDEVRGQVPIRSLGAGRTITTELIRTAPVVRRGETVELTVRNGGLTVAALGVAKTDGAPGETIPVENARTGRRLLGLVQQDGSLLITRAATPRRQR